MDKGGGKGYTPFPSKGHKSSQKYVSFKDGNQGKGATGGGVSNGGKNIPPKDTQPLELKIEDELPKNVKCLMDCEAAEILQGIQEQMVFLSRDPSIKTPMSFDKGLQYAETGARYTNPQAVRRALEPLSMYGVTDGEICAIANVCPETADEVFALVRSLQSKKSMLEEPLKAALHEIVKLKIPNEV